MNNRSLKNSITYIFLVFFISMKMSGIHVLFHIDDKDHTENCVICDYALTHNLTPTITSNTQSFIAESIEFILKKDVIENYYFFSCKKIVPAQLFSRPPPILR